MAVSITGIDRRWTGSGFEIDANMVFDSSYSFGGELLVPGKLGIDRLNHVTIENRHGYTFEYDYTNQKIRGFMAAKPIIFEELVTVTDNVGTLKYPAAFISYVSSGNAAFKVIASGLVPVAGSCAVSEFSWGQRPTLTFKASDSVTSCYVTYITQAWKEVFDNLVYAKITAGARVSGHAGLTFTPGTPDLINLGENAVAIQSITWDDNGTYKPMKALYKAETAATTEATIDFTDSADTSISVLQTDTLDASTDSVYITYIKAPASGFLLDRFVEEDDLTPSTDVATVDSGTIFGSNMLIYGTCGTIAGPTTKYADLIRSAGSVGTTATLAKMSQVNVSPNTITFGSNHADTYHVKPSYICGYPWEIPNTVPIEIPDATDLSWLGSIKIRFTGV